MKNPCKNCLIRPICISRQHKIALNYPKDNHSVRMIKLARQCKHLQEYVDQLLKLQYDKYPDMICIYFAIVKEQVEFPRIF